MAFKEVALVEVIEILRRWQTGAGMRALARGTSLSRNTIRKYIEAAEMHHGLASPWACKEAGTREG